MECWREERKEGGKKLIMARRRAVREERYKAKGRIKVRLIIREEGNRGVLKEGKKLREKTDNKGEQRRVGMSLPLPLILEEVEEREERKER